MAEQDIAMNAFQIVTNVAYIYAEAANGSQVKIKKDTFLNGIMKEMSLPRSDTNTIGDYDELDSGYGFYNNTINPEKPDVPLNKNDAFQKVQKRRVQEKR